MKKLKFFKYMLGAIIGVFSFFIGTLIGAGAMIAATHLDKRANRRYK